MRRRKYLCGFLVLCLVILIAASLFSCKKKDVETRYPVQKIETARPDSAAPFQGEMKSAPEPAGDGGGSYSFEEKEPGPEDDPGK